MTIDYTDAVFAKRLASIRTDRKMSQADLAEAAGVSKDSIINWECGRCTPHLDAACKIADVLGCAIDDLVRPFPATMSELVSEAAQSAAANAAASPYAEVDRFAGAAKHTVAPLLAPAV